MPTVKVLRKLGAQIQAGSSHEDGSMFQLPITTGIFTQTYDMLEDEAISGYAFKDIPQQGPRHVNGGGLTFNLDVISCKPLFTACMGDETSDVYTFPANNTEKLSLSALDSVNNVELASQYISSLALTGSSDAMWAMAVDFLGETAEDRTAVGTFPSLTAYDTPMTFQEAGGANGYIRIGDADDALDSGDNYCLDDFGLTMAPNFGEQFANCQKGTLTPLFGAARPEASGTFTVSRHTADTFLDWEDAHTPLQAELLIYKSATQQVKIQIPRFVVKAELTDDDTTKISVEMMIGRNGLGSTYKNTEMGFVSPVKITVTDS